MLESIKIDSNLHVQLQYNGDPIPLPPWFVKGRDATLNRRSQLLNLPAYIRSVGEETPHSLLGEMKQ